MEKDLLSGRVGENIARLRKENRMTQAQFAEILNVSPTFISRVERGERMFSPQKLQLVAELFGVSYDALFRNQEEIDPSIQNIVFLLTGHSREYTASVERLLRLWQELPER